MPTATEPKRKYARRSSPITRRGRPQISPRDIEVFNYLMTQRYASSDDLHALLGGDKICFTDRLRELTAWGYLARPAAQFKTIIAYRNPLVYQIGPEALRYLQEKRGDNREPPRGATNLFGHDLIAARVHASFRIGCMRTGARFISWEDMQKSKSMPPATLENPKPWIIPRVRFQIEGEWREKDVEGDDKPFGIAVKDAEGRERYRMTRGVEADGNTEPWSRRKSEGVNLEEKIAADLALLEKRSYRTLWGTPNCYIPYIFCSYTRMQSIMERVRKYTDGEGSPYILFAYFPRFDDENAPWPKADCHMLTNPWQRVGHAPFKFLEV